MARYPQAVTGVSIKKFVQALRPLQEVTVNGQSPTAQPRIPADSQSLLDRLAHSTCASQVRCGHAPQTMAMLRNLAVPVRASLGHCRWSSEAVHWVTYGAFTRPLGLIGIS